MSKSHELSNFIWSMADLLRDPYRPPLSFDKLRSDPDHAHLHLVSYINGFSENVRKIFERFDFGNEIERMREHNREAPREAAT